MPGEAIFLGSQKPHADEFESPGCFRPTTEITDSHEMPLNMLDELLKG